MNEIVKNNALKYGVIAGLIPIVYTLYAYLIDLTLMVSFFAGIGMWIVMMVVFVLAVAKSKKAMGGFISFKDAFSTFILAYIVSAVLSGVFSLVLFVVIDPDVSQQINELTIEKSVEMMERFGTPEDQIDAQIEAMEGQNNFNTWGIIKSLLIGIVIYSVLGLIVAAIMKKKEPEFS
jgi:hypothetical protein